MKIQLVYFAGCPNLEAARQVLRDSLCACGLPPVFGEVDVSDDGAPSDLRDWGSPTILVDGRDVAGGQQSGVSCRLYDGPDGRGAPPRALIEQALRTAKT